MRMVHHYLYCCCTYLYIYIYISRMHASLRASFSIIHVSMSETSCKQYMSTLDSFRLMINWHLHACISNAIECTSALNRQPAQAGLVTKK